MVTEENLIYINIILEKFNLTSLNSMQEGAIDNGLFDPENFIISSPTGSGKTILALIRIAKCIDNSKKAIYICNTRALNAQVEKLLRILDSHTYLLQGGTYQAVIEEAMYNAKIITITLEKLVIIMRKYPDLLDDVGQIVIDEIHMIADQHRGPTLEGLIATLRYLQYIGKWEGHMLGMSGTLYNYEEIARRMNALYYATTKREIPFEPYILDVQRDNRLFQLISPSNNKTISMGIPRRFEFMDEAEERVMLAAYYLYKNKKKAIVLCKTRKSTKIYAASFKQLLLDQGIEDFSIFYHHAGLSDQKKELVEKQCNKGRFSVIFSTTTLAMGVDFPFDAVVLTFKKLFNPIYDWDEDENSEIDPYMVLTIHQIIGRVGHQKGTEAFVISAGENFIEAQQIHHIAFVSKPPVQSRMLSFQGKLKMQEYIAAGIYGYYIKSVEDIENYVKFYLFSFHLTDQVISFLGNEIYDFLSNPWIEVLFMGKTYPSSETSILELISINELSDIEVRISRPINLLIEKLYSPKQLRLFISRLDEIKQDNELTNYQFADRDGHYVKNSKCAPFAKAAVMTDLHLVMDLKEMNRNSSHIKYRSKTKDEKVAQFYNSLSVIDEIFALEKRERTELPRDWKKVWKRVYYLLEIFKIALRKKYIDGAIEKISYLKDNQAIIDFLNDKNWSGKARKMMVHAYNASNLM